METVAEHVITKCGGARRVAEMLSLDTATVHKWKYPAERGGTGGVVPAGRQFELLSKAREAGIDLIPNDFFPVDAPRLASTQEDGAK